jgi:hypothetical protein
MENICFCACIEKGVKSMGFQEVIDNALLGGEQEALMDYPLHIRRAFAWVGVYNDPYHDKETSEEELESNQKNPWDLVRENVQEFIQCWGGLEEAALLRALHEDTGIDRLKAIFAIGYSPFPHALDTIAPYLKSSDRIERCAAACVMGVQRDERAIEVLKEFYLQDDVDASGKMISEAEFWYQNYYAILALVLANWGPPEMTEILRSALVRINSPEYSRAIGYNGNEFTPSHLFYALGRRGLFSILGDVQLSDRGRFMALFSLAAGYLNVYEQYENPYWAMEQDEDLRRELITVWKEHLGLLDQEIQECFAAFNQLGPTLFNLVWWRKYD